MRRIDDCLSVRDGRLWMDGCDLVDVAGRFGTPLYAVSEGQLGRNLRAVEGAFAAAWPHGPVRLLPSLKANFSLALRRLLSRAGAGCDTFGAGELYAALEAGVRPDLISVNGSVKDATLVERAVAAGARVTLDSERELGMVADAARRTGSRPSVRIRLRPDYDGLHQRSDFFPDLDVRQAAQRYKPGVPAEQAVELGRRVLATEGLRLTGLMAHLGRHSADPDVWRGMAASFAELVGRCCAAWDGWRPAELDVGGGLPARRDPTSPTGAAPAPLPEYAAAIAGTLGSELAGRGVEPAGVALEVEPGRSLYADTGVHLTTVRNVKAQQAPIPWTWIECDTTEMFLADLLIEHARFPVQVASRADEPPSVTADVVGLSCGFDVLATQIPLPDVREGDVVALLDTGAYQDACASNFNALPRPGTVLVSGDRVEWIKRPETVEQVFSRDVIPPHLR